MKTSIFSFLFLITLSLSGLAQDYDADLQSLLPQIGTATKPAELSLLASQLSSLAKGEPNRWEASFWAAHCMVLQAFGEKDADKVDPILDQAEPVIEKLIKMKPTEPEFYVLRAMLNQARIAVNPMLRGMKYAGRANDNLDLAIELDANNPRAWHLKGANVFGTPSMFGGGKEKAKPLFQKAGSLFSTYTQRSPYHPNWGKEQNDKMLKACDQE